jgi:hypothetical protein
MSLKKLVESLTDRERDLLTGLLDGHQVKGKQREYITINNKSLMIADCFVLRYWSHSDETEVYIAPQLVNKLTRLLKGTQ